MRHPEVALTPVRLALATDAAHTADAVLVAAAAEAREVEAAAHREAEEILAAARADGTEAGRAAAALGDARARRDAHGHVLATAARLRDELVAQALAEAAALRDDPRYPALVEAWTARCRAALGPDARVREVPQGGVVGESGTRRLDLRLTTLAEHAALDALTEAGEPWS